MASAVLVGLPHDPHPHHQHHHRQNQRGSSFLGLSISPVSTSSSGPSSRAASQSSSPASSSRSASSPPVGNVATPYFGPDMAPEPVTKIEELEEEDDLMNVPPLPDLPELPELLQQKRPRGRPRKHPLPAARQVQKVTKGRSKTGCITCRRRKKKCDETKPECNNCVKNAVICEGYPEKTVWQPGRPREGRTNSIINFPFRPLPVLVDGVESKTDQKLLHHFSINVSRLLTLFDDEHNPFREILLPRAMHNRALMHSLLCLAGSHLTQVGMSPEKEVYEQSRNHHFGQALHYLNEDIEVLKQNAHAREAEDQYSTVATSMIMCLDSICSGDTQATYVPHLNAARAMLADINNPNELSNFLVEFFMYHDVVNSVTILRPLGQLYNNYTLPAFIMQPESGALLGVLDGLFGFMSKITLIRSQIRTRRQQKLDPLFNFETLTQAVAIDAELRDWNPPHDPTTSRYIAAQLYRQCTWVYLYRTVQNSRPSEKIQEAVSAGLEYLRYLPEQSGTQSILLMPLFLLGCAAFDESQRPEISERFNGLRRYSGLGNIKVAYEVVQRVWAKMDAGLEEESWDWEAIIQSMGYDFLVT